MKKIFFKFAAVILLLSALEATALNHLKLSEAPPASAGSMLTSW